MMRRFGRVSVLTLTAALPGVLSGMGAHAQMSSEEALVAYVKLPDSPGQQMAAQQMAGNITGAVLDANGAEVEGAQVTLESGDPRSQRTTTTDYTGSFRFVGVAGGTFRIKVAAAGFAVWSSEEQTLQPGQMFEMPDISLKVAEAKTDVEVVFTKHDLAEEQMKAEEKQRVLGFFPNFYVTYRWDAVPLSAGQKFRLALRTSVDPVSFGISGVVAGVEQWQNDFSGYGQGVAGYGKRYAASWGDGFVSTMIGSALLPSVLHQDPRYFYLGKGTVMHRAMYAISTVVICKGDNGKWQPNYSNVLGNLAAAGISNAYYPSTDRNGASLTIDNALIGTASGAAGALIQEFFIKKITKGIQP